MLKKLLSGSLLCLLVVSSALAADDAKAPKSSAPASGKGKVDVVLIETTMGNIKVELYADKAPKTVANFLAYVKDGYYAGTIFHRVIPNFMIQGGGFTSSMDQKTTKAAIPLESQNGLKNVRGTIAMARTKDPNSATSQFFINVKDNPSLDYPKPDGNGYAVFGKVLEGMDVADKIVAVATTTKGMFSDVPVDPILIKSVKLVTPASK
jgi:peptidyl-prolyl cis-trans isomerase A (cyclophilin A)